MLLYRGKRVNYILMIKSLLKKKKKKETKLAMNVALSED